MSILKNSEIKNDSLLETKVCIIGSGISAQLIASQLKNIEIIMIDSGKINYDQESQNLNQIEEIGIPFRKNSHNRIRQLGGSANLWANQLMILKKKIVIPRNWVAKDFSFPFDYDSLLSLYKEAIETVYNNKFKNLNYIDPQKENIKNLFLEKEFLKTDIFETYDHFWPSKVEKFNYKSNFTKNIINLNNLKFIENFTATEIKMNNEKQAIESIKIQSKNKACKIKANFFIIACGAIENARLILNNEKFNKILQNPNTGRYFMDHPRITLGEIKSNSKFPLSNLLGIKYNDYDFRKSIRLTDDYQMEKKVLDGYAFLDPKYEKDDENNFENFLNEIKILLKFKGFPKIKNIFSNYRKNFEQIYLKLSPQISNSHFNNLLRTIYNSKNYFFSFNRMYVNYQSEQYPNYESRMYLSPNKDYFNQHKAIIDWKLSNIDYKTYDEFVMALKNKLDLVPSLKFHEYKEKKITDASHHSGTTRMSLNRSDGVVDQNCKFHDIQNLFISGSSVLRSAGSVNPGLTNMAMSIKLAKHIKKIL